MRSRVIAFVAAILAAVVGCGRSPVPGDTPAVTPTLTPTPTPSPAVIPPDRSDADEMFPGSLPDDTPGAYQPKTVTDLRRTLNGDEFHGTAIGYAREGEKLFPLYLDLLEDRSSEVIHVGRVFAILSLVQADRSRFRDITLERVFDKNPNTRHCAAEFLSIVGTSADTAVLYPLLYDLDSGVVCAAGGTMVTIGGARDLAVFDFAMRNAGKYLRSDGKLMFGKWYTDELTKCRVQLEARLKKEEREKGSPKAKPPEPKK